MIRTTLVSILALGFAVLGNAGDKGTPAVIAVKAEVKLDLKPGKVSEPTKVTSAEELEKLVDKKETREAIAKEVDLKTYDLLIFCWQGSGGDKLTYNVAESLPEQVGFVKTPGRTKDLRTHTVLYAVRKDVKWSAK